MKRSLICGLLLLFSATCFGQQGGEFVLRGTINGKERPAKVYLTYKDRTDGAFILADSAEVSGRSFEMRGHIDAPAEAALYVSYFPEPNRPYAENGSFFYIEPGEIVFGIEDDWRHTTVAGSPMNDDRAHYAVINRERNARFSGLVEEMNRLQAMARTPETAAFVKKALGVEAHVDTTARKPENLDALIKEKRAEMDRIDYENALALVAARPDSYYALTVLCPSVLHSHDADKAQKMFDMFSGRMRQTEAGMALGERIESWKATAVGKPAPDFTMNDPEGRAVSLSDFRGRYVFVDFWASWCRPCRDENPNVLAAYERFRGNGFTVLGVSLDGPGDAGWIKAIADDKLPWTQVSELNGWKSAIVKTYDIVGIPANVLVDPDGVIIKKNLHGEQLSESLEELFGPDGPADE